MPPSPLPHTFTHSLPLPPPLRRLQHNGEAEVRSVQDAMSDIDAAAAALDLEEREATDAIAGLQTEKELQSGGEVKELQAEVDEIAKK